MVVHISGPCLQSSMVLQSVMHEISCMHQSCIIHVSVNLTAEVIMLVQVPEHVYLIDAAPHDWLFQQCSGVVHHGGAGTVAAGLIANCPTLVVPFFGDQPFW